MSWQVLITISIILYSVSVLLQRILLKNEKSEPVSFSVFFQISVALVTAILVMIFKGGFVWPNVSEISWSLLIMTLLYALANVFIFKSLKEIEASRFTVIFSGKTIFAVLGASIFFRENLSALQWLGALLIILGVITISLKNIKLNFGKGEIFAFFGAVFFGLANTNDRFLIRFFDPFTYVVIGFLLPGILIALIYPKKLTLLKIYFDKSIIFKMIILCGLYGMSAVAFFAALQVTTNASQVFAVNAFTGILSVVLAIIFLKERDQLSKKISGAVLSLIGLLLVNK